MVLQKQLIALVDEDTNAFNSIIKAFSLPKETSKEKKLRNVEIQKPQEMQLKSHLKLCRTIIDSFTID